MWLKAEHATLLLWPVVDPELADSCRSVAHWLACSRCPPSPSLSL